MDFSDIERILALVREHDLAEFELERDGLKVRVRKAGAPTFHATPMQIAAAPVMHAAPAALPAAMTAGPPAGRPHDVEAVEIAGGESPLGRTLHTGPAPGAPAVVQIGPR